MALVGLPLEEGMPPQEAQVPTATTAAAPGERRASHPRGGIFRPLRGAPLTPSISDPAGKAPPWVIDTPPVFSFVLDLRVGRPLPPPELPVAIESLSS